MKEDFTALLPEDNLHVINARCSCELHGSKKVWENLMAMACEHMVQCTHVVALCNANAGLQPCLALLLLC